MGALRREQEGDLSQIALLCDYTMYMYTPNPLQMLDLEDGV
jgi:hypothetical protein